MDRAVIVEAALALLDETGLDGLTTRGLAARLQVKSPALYWHCSSKQELLEEMARAIQYRRDSGPPLGGEDWRDWLARRARERRTALLAHRDGARLVSGTSPGTQVAQSFDRDLAALTEQGFTPVGALRAVTALGAYVTGFVLEEQARAGRETAAAPRPPDMAAAPVLMAAIRDGGSPDGPAAFDDGLALLLTGIAASRDAGAADPSSGNS